MENQGDGHRPRQDGDKSQRELMRSGDLEPGVLQKVATKGVRYSQRQCLGHDLVRGVQAKEVAEALAPLKFPKSEAEEPQRKAD